MDMTPQQELDLRVAAANVARSIEEMIFLGLTHGYNERRGIAIKTFSENIVELIRRIPK